MICLSRVMIENFYSLLKVDVALEPLTVFIGPNGAGKSNFIDSFQFVADALMRGLEPVISERGGLPRIRYRQKRRSHTRMVFSGRSKGNTWTYSFDLASSRKSQDGFLIAEESCSIYREDGTLADVFERTKNRWTKGKAAKGFENIRLDSRLLFLPFLREVEFFQDILDILTDVAVYREFSEIAYQPKSPVVDPRLAASGENLGSIVKSILDSDWRGDFLQGLHQLVDDIADCRVQTLDNLQFIQLGHQGNKKGLDWFGIKEESDGTRRFLALLAVLYQPKMPKILCVEEPEIYIHPGALSFLCELFQEAGDKRQQVFLSTHSPELLDLFPAKSIKSVLRGDNGTIIEELDPAIREILEEKMFSPGELMRANQLYKKLEQE